MRNQLFIDNEWVDAAGGRTFPTINPATEESITEVALASAADVDRAAQSSARAMRGEWRRLPPERRGELLYRLADLIDAHKDAIAALETRDMGKPLRESYANVARSSRTCRYYAGAVDKLVGDQIPIGLSGLSFTMFEPLGVTAHITPWNYPFANACRSLPAALAAGSTVIIKPASDTPLTTLLLGELCAAAGFPPGAVNILPGSGSETGAVLANHPLVRSITFTGSIPTGKRIAAYAAERLIPTVLELGGKNPQIVFADADFENAIMQTMRGAFTNAGQVCTSVGRVLIERPIYNRYVEALEAKITALTIGDGLDNPDIGPLVSRAHYAEVERYVTIGRDKDGARLVTGGTRAEGFAKGYFWRPTLFHQVDPAMTIAREEIFGPVLAVIPFDTDDAALAIANGLRMGLTSGVFTQDVNRAIRFVRDLEAGMVWVNDWFLSPVQTPHGGVKDSGLGREQGMPALGNYAHIKSVAIRSGPAPDGRART
jgi:aldehyde dehydrogenase (NAD+)